MEEPSQELIVAVDTSYAPPHEQYRSVQGVLLSHEGNPLMWSSTRQGFVTQSTAEAELMGYTEGLQCGLSTMALLEVLNLNVTQAAAGGQAGGSEPVLFRHRSLEDTSLETTID